MGKSRKPWANYNVNIFNWSNQAFLLFLYFKIKIVPQNQYHKLQRKHVSIAVLLGIFLLNLVNPSFPSLRCQINPNTIAVDPSISHKYAGDTVTNISLMIFGILVPFLQILVTEFLYNQTVRRGSFNTPETSRWKRTTLYAGRWYRDFIFGLLFTVFINDIGKTTMSAPRPHFIDTCKPNFTKEACYMGWVNDYECANPDISHFKMIDARKSFPSGHAAIAMYGALFMIFYQQSRVNVKKLGSMTLLWLHLLWLGWGFFCALSRVADHRHHPIDITFGAIIGSIGGVFSAVYLCKTFQEKLTIEPFQRQVMSGMNGTATVLEGFSNSDQVTRPDTTAGINNGVTPSTPQKPNGDIKRPSLRRLLSTQSTLTTMSDISEDEEVENV